MQGIVGRVCVVVTLLALPVVSDAQGLGSIAGVVRDASGAVMPGVAVEAASPALIEKVRTGVTDGTGRYAVVSLPVGVYSVTFTLPGFNTIRREDVEVAANFTTTVNADLAVGALSETVTVSGESPIVDVQAAAQTRALTARTFKEIPSGGSWSNMAGLIPAVNVTGGLDVGGSTGDPVGAALTAHGSGVLDQNQMIDGIKIGNILVAGARAGISISPLLFDEVNVNYAGQGADATTNGVQINAIPKSGGNTFQGAILFSGTNDSLQSDNLTDRLAALGLTSSNTLKELYDVNGAFGGPIFKDRLWFFGTSRYNTSKTNVAGLFYPVDPTAIVRVEDLSRAGFTEQTFNDFTLRLTGTVTPKHRVTAYAQFQGKCACWGVSQTTSPEASIRTKWPHYLGQVSWTYTATNRLLIETGWSIGDSSYTQYPQEGPTGTYAIPISSQAGTVSPQINYRAPATGMNRNTLRHHAWRASASYTTGSHSVKVGADNFDGNILYRQLNFTGYQQYRTRDSIPNQVTIYAPLAGSKANHDLGLGLYAQDRWTLKRLTLNGGIRLDLNNSSVDEFTSQPTFWLPNRNTVYPAVKDIAKWQDINPRIGVAYDLFGNGRTALKFSANRAVTQDGIGTANANNPSQTVTTSVARTWTDNGNFVPDCDLANGALQDNRASGGDLCGPWQNNTFGNATPATQYDPAHLRGWHVRPWNWEFSGGVQHEIIPRLSANVAYFRRVQGNFTVTDNTLVDTEDYRPYSVTVPTDPRLPNSGQVISGLYDITPALQSASNNFVTFASNFGDQYRHFNGWDFMVDARFRNGLLLQGGVAIGNTIADNCDVVAHLDNPSQYLCHTQTGYLPQLKLLGSYELPWWGIRLSGTYQGLPGAEINANVIYTGAQIVAANPSLGVFSTGPAGQATVNVIAPGEQYNERVHQLDWRFTKVVRLGNQSLDLNVDLYNALNSDTILTQNNAYGATWLRPLTIIPPRFIKFSARFDF